MIFTPARPLILPDRIFFVRLLAAFRGIVTFSRNVMLSMTIWYVSGHDRWFDGCDGEHNSVMIVSVRATIKVDKGVLRLYFERLARAVAMWWFTNYTVQ